MLFVLGFHMVTSHCLVQYSVPSCLFVWVDLLLLSEGVSGIVLVQFCSVLGSGSGSGTVGSVVHRSGRAAVFVAVRSVGMY